MPERKETIDAVTQNLPASAVVPSVSDPGCLRPPHTGGGARDLVEHLRAQGKQVEFLVFENEGHDVIKFKNKVRCYIAIVQFFSLHLRP